MGKRMTMKRDCTVLVKRIRAITAQSSIVEIVQLRVTVEWELLVEDISRDMADYLCSGRD